MYSTLKPARPVAVIENTVAVGQRQIAVIELIQLGFDMMAPIQIIVIGTEKMRAIQLDQALQRPAVPLHWRQCVDCKRPFNGHQVIDIRYRSLVRLR